MYPASLSASGPRGKKPRSLTAAQLAVLTEKFAQNQYLQESEAAELSGMLGMTVKQVHNWYGKRRYTLKQKAAQNPGPSHSFEESEVTSNAGGSNSIDESAQFDSDQLQQLEAAYERNHIINYKEAEILSLRLNIPAIKIRVWFANKLISMRNREEEAASRAESASQTSLDSAKIPPQIELLDTTTPSSRRSRRPHGSLTHEQQNILNDSFSRTAYETEEGFQKLATRTGLTVKQIQTWYSRKRFNAKKRKRSKSPVPVGAATPSTAIEFKSYNMLTGQQTAVLNAQYANNPYVDDETSALISDQISVSVEKIKTWFKSKRKLENKKRKMQEGSHEQHEDAGWGEVGAGSEVSASDMDKRSVPSPRASFLVDNHSASSGVEIVEEQVLASLLGVDVDRVKQLKEQLNGEDPT